MFADLAIMFADFVILFADLAIMFADFAIMFADFAILFADFAIMFADLAIMFADLAILFVDFAILFADFAIMFADLVILFADFAIMFADLAIMFADLAIMFADLAIMFAGFAIMFADFAIMFAGFAIMFADFAIMFADFAIMFADFAIMFADFAIMFADLAILFADSRPESTFWIFGEPIYVSTFYIHMQGLSTTPVQYGHRHSLTLDYHHRDDDQDSVSSMASNTSSLCEHAHFARNGTTYSARKMKYIVHCASHSDQDGEYLTPTQRANRSIRRLRTLLAEAQAEIMDKENEIMRLTKELVEIRLNKASPDMKDGQDGTDGKHCDGHITSTTLEDNASSISTNGAVSPQLGDLPLSLADSGHFEDLPCSNHHLERELERVRKMHDDMREKYHDKVESLLKKITETNDKFYGLKPQYDSAALRVKELEKENADLKKSMKEQEDLHQSMVTLYAKEKQGLVEAVQKSNQTNEKSNQANQTDSVITPVHHTLAPTPSPVPPPKSVADENVPKILQELEITRRELEEIKVHLLMPPAPSQVSPPAPSTSSKKRVKSKLKNFKWKTLSTMFRNPSARSQTL
ncbi:hypothetical protein M8J77_021001 [Diaphorina citri]|nr:hypothetical protein M8J77_021001 [Diaphorina citri]